MIEDEDIEKILADSTARVETIRKEIAEKQRELEFEIEVNRRLHSKLYPLLPEVSVRVALRPSLADQAQELLRKHGKPMRLTKIVDELKALGNVSISERGLLPQVGSALIRRSDIFVKLARGIYGLAEWGKNQLAPETAA